jgi:hypothetical protein
MLPVVLLGGAALASSALFLKHAAFHHEHSYRLVLHADERADAVYLSAWSEGDVFVAHEPSDKQTISFTRKSEEHDGCTWMGTERLVPFDHRVYGYRYEETLLACRPGAHPFSMTPRTGYVTVEDADGEHALTTRDGILPAGELWPNEVAEIDDQNDELLNDDEAQEVAEDCNN